MLKIVSVKFKHEYAEVCYQMIDCCFSYFIYSPHEVRGVHRTVLLKTLSSALPSGSVRYNATPENFSFDHKTKNVKVSLKDGEEITAKVGQQHELKSWNIFR